ncbi:MAG: hypothetical protein RLY14_3084 [Planctomycetota bacterium]|jgi:hypothetical protein
MKSYTDRRTFLQTSAAAMSTAMLMQGQPLLGAVANRSVAKKRVAGVVTIYRHNSHSDVIIGKILDGWNQDGGPGPNLEMVSLYVDQFPEDDMSRNLAEKHGFRLCKTIQEAIDLGTDEVAVDGVLCIGEHGDYPWNEKEQHLYPRKRLFKEITDTFAKRGKVVPIFHDKHPGPQWEDAKWMYDRAKEMNVPWMAGSSLPVGYRSPDVTLPFGSKVEAAIGIGYSGLDIYGFHTLDFLQSILERRQGAEQGVEWVQSLPTSEIGKLIEQGVIRVDLLDAALKVAGTDRAALLASPPVADGAAFLIGYRDGMTVPVLMLQGLAQGICAAVKPVGADLFATRVEERTDPRHPHFAFLLKGIEKMFHTGVPTYPVERTMLSAGILDRLLTSRFENHRKIDTPELAIRYRPVDYAYAPHIELSQKF